METLLSPGEFVGIHFGELIPSHIFDERVENTIFRESFVADFTQNSRWLGVDTKHHVSINIYIN